jgi:hypothetical protein
VGTERDLLLVVANKVQSLADAPQEVSGQWDHVGRVIQSSYHQMEVSESDGSCVNGVTDVGCPGDELVEG